VEARQEVTPCREHDVAMLLPAPTHSRERMPQAGRIGVKLSCHIRDKKSVVAGEAKRNSSKLTVQRGNLYENKGPLWKTWPRSRNVYENTGT